MAVLTIKGCSPGHPRVIFFRPRPTPKLIDNLAVSQARGMTGCGCVTAPLKLDKIPQELKERPQWVLWRKEEQEGKSTKIPYQPRNPQKKASSTNSDTWGTFEQAINATKIDSFDGIGYVFSKDDPYTGVDLDKCRDPKTKKIEAWAWKEIKRLDSYTEVSPSATGVKIWVKGTLPPGGRKKGNYEMYSYGRFFTMTSVHLEGTPTTIEDRQAELEALHKEVFGKPETELRAPSPVPTLELSDRELLDKATAARNGEKFSRLWQGDTTGHPSPSEATAALLNLLVFWTGRDFARVDRLFRQSGLMREKWDRPQSGSTWGNLEIHKAIARGKEFYQTTRSAQNDNRPQSEAPKPFPPEISKFWTPQAAANQARTAPAIRFVSGKELEALDFPEPVWIIPNILGEGYIILAGRPKLGKSWLGLCLAVAVATGGCALGKDHLRATQGKVLYLGLEDRLRRLKRRLTQILCGSPFPENLLIAESWPRLDKGGLEALQDFLKEHEDCRLVILDTLAKVRPQRQKNSDPYEFDMMVGGALQSLAHQYHVTLLVVHHTRKMIADDPLDEVSGTTGITGAADAVMILKRGRGTADGTLSLTGRDIEEQELALKFHPKEGLWELLGEAAEYAMSQERQEILSILRNIGPKTPPQLANILDKSKDAIRMNLLRMKVAGIVRLNDNGEYQIV